MIKYNYSTPELKAINICAQIAEFKNNINSQGYVIGLTDYNIAIELFNKHEELINFIANSRIIDICDYNQCKKFLFDFITKYRKKNNVTDFWHL